MPADQVSPTVLVACDDLTLLDDIVRHLEDIPTWKLISSPGSAAQMISACEVNSPDSVILSDALARDLDRRPESLLSPSLVVVGRQETNESLRAALKLEARGFVLWPDESRQLQNLVEKDVAGRLSHAAPSGRLFAVWAPKGGSGASVVAAHLAACMAGRGKGCILVDGDLDNADQSSLLGVSEGTRNLSDLLRMADELSPRLVDSVAWKHPDGFKAVLSQGIPGETALVKVTELSRVLSSIREAADNVVVDVPSGLNDISLGVIQEATATLVVVTPDLLCLKRARDGLRTVRNSGVAESRLVLVLNQTSGSGVSSKDVTSILGLKPAAEVRADVQIYHSANRGELSPAGRKMLTRLVRVLCEDDGRGNEGQRRNGRRGAA